MSGLQEALEKALEDWTKERLVEETNACLVCGTDHNGLQCPFTHWVAPGTTA